MSISSTGLYGSATIVNSDLFNDVEDLKEQVTTLSTSYLDTTREHREDISQNRLDISLNRQDISQNKADISLNRFDISQNKADISLNRVDISQNKADILPVGSSPGLRFLHARPLPAISASRLSLSIASRHCIPCTFLPKTSSSGCWFIDRLFTASIWISLSLSVSRSCIRCSRISRNRPDCISTSC